jgi:hypothetical protein
MKRRKRRSNPETESLEALLNGQQYPEVYWSCAPDEQPDKCSYRTELQNSEKGFRSLEPLPGYDIRTPSHL